MSELHCTIFIYWTKLVKERGKQMPHATICSFIITIDVWKLHLDAKRKLRKQIIIENNSAYSIMNFTVILKVSPPPSPHACINIYIHSGIIEVIFFSDPRPINYQNVNRAVEDVNIQLHNWEILVRNIRAYYVVGNSVTLNLGHLLS